MSEQMSSWPAMPLAVVVGAGAMGMAVARRLGQSHRVLLADVDAARLEQQAAALAEEGHLLTTVACDVTDRASVAALATAVGEHGPLRVLAHVVGLSPSMADWRRIMQVNLIGATLMADAMLPHARAGTAAIFVASLAAHVSLPSEEVLHVLARPLESDFLKTLVRVLGHEPTTTLSYQLSKLALIRMCQRRAWDWGQRKARIVSLSPGLIATPMGMLEFKNQPFKYDLLAKTPLGRQGGLMEVADAVEFLASDRASFITGTDLLVDGGISAALRHAGNSGS